jgi:hypothetical protein
MSLNIRPYLDFLLSLFIRLFSNKGIIFFTNIPLIKVHHFIKSVINTLEKKTHLFSFLKDEIIKTIAIVNKFNIDFIIKEGGSILKYWIH